MSNNVDITLVADEKQAAKALDRLNDRLMRTEAQLEKFRAVGKRATSESVSGFEDTSTSIQKMGEKVAGALTGFLSMRMAVKAIGDEWEASKRKQEAARLSTLGPAQAIREARLAFVPDKTVQDSQLESIIEQVAKETRAPVENVAVALQTAFSAKGSMTNEVAVDAVRQALKLDPSNAEQAAVLAGRFLDVAKFSGSTDIKANAGFIQNVQSASRVTTSEKVGANLIPAIGAGMSFGDTPEQAAEIVAAMTQLMGDEEGRISAGAFQRMGGQLMDFVPQRQSKGKLKGRLMGRDPFGEFAIPDEQYAAFQKATSTKSRLEVMRNSPELQRAFIGSASFEEKSKQQTLSMIRGDAKALNELRQAEAVVNPIDQDQRKLFEDKIQQLESGKHQQKLTAEQISQANVEQKKLKDRRYQDVAAARKMIKDTYENVDAIGGEWVKDVAFSLQTDSGADPYETAIKHLEGLKQHGLKKGVGGGIIPAVSRFGSNAARGRPEDIDFIDEQIKLLREQKKNSDETKRQMEEQTKLLQRIADGVEKRTNLDSPANRTRPASELSRTN